MIHRSMVFNAYSPISHVIFSCFLLIVWQFHTFAIKNEPRLTAVNLDGIGSKQNSHGWDRKAVRPHDRLVLENDYWALANFPSVRIPVLRAPHPTFGMVMPLPYWWSCTERFFPVDVNNLQFRFTGADNYILQSAIPRYKRLLADRTGLSVYAHRWLHQESSLADLAKQYQTNRRKFTRVTGTAGTDGETAERPTFWWSEKRIQWLLRIFKVTRTSESSSPISYVHLHVRSSGKDYPSLEMDESYALLVDAGGIYLVANETWGALRGLESISQLMWRTSDYASVFINETYIFDRPRFPHRGLLVDTSRHYISKSIMLINLEAMAYNKMNVLHWHIIDDNSYPYQSKMFPELSRKGAWNQRQVYTENDIKEIIEFARLRGIRVIPEFDIPGHSRSLAYSKPELLAQCQGFDDNIVHFGPLNPFLNETYQFIENLLTEVINLFPDEYIHLGGDEVEPVCWDADAEIVRAQSKSNLKEILTSEYFWKRVQNVVTNLGNRHPELRRKVIAWQEITKQAIDIKSSIVAQIWKPDVPPDYLMTDNVLFSSCWYLDNLNFVRNWASYYLCEPIRQLDLQLGSGSVKLIGGEACMWAEYQADDTILQKIWPVTSGVAERLWSPHWVNNITTVGPRIEEQRCRMISRGIPQSVLLGPGACEFAGAMTALADSAVSLTGGARISQSFGTTDAVINGVLPFILCVTCALIISAFFVFTLYKCSTTKKWKFLACLPRRLSVTRIFFFSVSLIGICYFFLQFIILPYNKG